MSWVRDAALPAAIVLAALGAFAWGRAADLGPPPGWQGPLHALRAQLEPPPAPGGLTQRWDLPGARTPRFREDGVLACEGIGGTYLMRGDEARLIPGEGILAAGRAHWVAKGATLFPLDGGPPALHANSALIEAVARGAQVVALASDGQLHDLNGRFLPLTVPAGAAHLALDPSGDALVFSLQGQLIRQEFQTGAQLPLGPGDYPAFADDGTLLWLQREGEEWALRSDRGPLITPVEPSLLSVSGGWVAVLRAGAAHTVTLARVDGSAAVEVETELSEPHGVALHLGDGGPLLAVVGKDALLAQRLPLRFIAPVAPTQ